MYVCVWCATIFDARHKMLCYAAHYERAPAQRDLVEEFLEFGKTGYVDVIARSGGLAFFVPGDDIWIFR